jgi:hypothetical protein
MMGHELHLTRADGTTTTYGLMNRRDAVAAEAQLAGRFGGRFQRSKSRAYAFFERIGPFMVK